MYVHISLIGIRNINVNYFTHKYYKINLQWAVHSCFLCAYFSFCAVPRQHKGVCSIIKPRVIVAKNTSNTGRGGDQMISIIGSFLVHCYCKWETDRQTARVRACVCVCYKVIISLKPFLAISDWGLPNGKSSSSSSFESVLIELISSLNRFKNEM